MRSISNGILNKEPPRAEPHAWWWERSENESRKKITSFSSYSISSGISAQRRDIQAKSERIEGLGWLSASFSSWLLTCFHSVSSRTLPVVLPDFSSAFRAFFHAGEHQVELLVGEVPVGLEVAEERGIKRLEETLGCESLVLLSGIPLGALQRCDSLL